MSSQNQETCENLPLLGDAPAGRSRLSKERLRPETLLIPLVFATRLGNVITTTTFFELSNLIASGMMPMELCNAPEVVRNFATVTATLGVIGGLVSMVGCGLLNRISSHYGRKPVFLFMFIVYITWSCLIPASQFLPDGISDWVLFLGMLIHVFSVTSPFNYLVNLYVVDVCAPEDRTTTLSKMGGWSALGGCIPLLLGGTITTRTGNHFIVFYIAAATFIALSIYVPFVLPETLPKEKRNALRPEGSVYSTTTHSSLLRIFEPLKMLVPTRTTGGKLNWRLTWCGMHAFVFMVGHPLSSDAWLVFVTSKYHLTPADNGLFFTIATVSSTIVMTIMVPLLVHLMRPRYSQKIVRSAPPGDEGFSESEELGSRTSDHMNVHLAVASCVITTFFVLAVAMSTTKIVLVFSAVFVGFSSMHMPTTRSLVAGSVEPAKQGGAMAAIEMVDSVANVLSPMIMGSVLSATINSAVPRLVFYVQFVVILVGAGLLFLVKDADGYHELDDTSQDRSIAPR